MLAVSSSSHKPNQMSLPAQEWDCLQKSCGEWFFEHVFPSRSIKISTEDSPEKLIEDLSDDCGFGLSALNWFRVALVAYSQSNSSSLEEARYYILKGLEVDPYHKPLLGFKKKVFRLFNEKNKIEKPLYEQVLAEKDETKQMLLVIESLKRIKKLGTFHNPLRLYYMTQFRKIVDKEEFLDFENSIFYIEGFFECVDSEFFVENPELYFPSHLLILNSYLKIIRIYAEQNTEKLAIYIVKLKMRIVKISKIKNLWENIEIRSLAEAIMLDIDCLELKLLCKKVHEETARGEYKSLLAFIKLFPEDFTHQVYDVDLLVNASNIFFEQSKKSKSLLVKEKYLNKSRSIGEHLLEKKPNSKDYVETIIGIITSQIEVCIDKTRREGYKQDLLKYTRKSEKLNSIEKDKIARKKLFILHPPPSKIRKQDEKKREVKIVSKSLKEIQ